MVDYERLAAEYARHRRVHPGLLRGLLADLPAGGHVLEVGCGTGNYAAAVAAAGHACRGIDPSEQMLATAGATGAELKVGRAERLEYPDRTFDLVFSVDVIHHVGDRAAYFREAFRVLRGGGRVCTVTDSEEIIRGREPLAVYFPETVDIDLRRYPATNDLRRWAEEAGFRQPGVAVAEFPFLVESVAAYRDKAYSCLHLIPPEAHRRGVERMERDLGEGPVRGNSRYVLLWARKPDGGP
jgi:SAM-dependent methyltransferase